MTTITTTPNSYLDLLRKIADDIIIYEPLGRTPEDERIFLDTVHRLQKMERLGLVTRLLISSRPTASGGEEQVDFVMVQGGLTDEGKRLLITRAPC